MTRMVPYWEDAIAADLHAFDGVLVVAHGNSIRALVKYLKDITDDEIVGLEIPTGVPWWFRLADDLSSSSTTACSVTPTPSRPPPRPPPARRADTPG